MDFRALLALRRYKPFWNNIFGGGEKSQSYLFEERSQIDRYVLVQKIVIAELDALRIEKIFTKDVPAQKTHETVGN